jgi:hypothetical protein
MSLDFQRLARVRERRQSRRKRLLRIGSTLVVASALLAGGQLVAPILPGGLLASLLEQHVPWLSTGLSPVGEAQGRVQTVEAKAGIIHVSSGFLGLMSVPLVVTSDTLIVVGDKEGGFGDLREGARVKAVYDVGRDILRAKRVEVLGHGSRIASPASSR